LLFKLRLKSKSNLFAVFLIVSAIAVIIADIFLYPLLLPKIWTSQNSLWIEQTGYIFYIVIFAAMASAAIGFIRLLILSIPLLYNSIDNGDNTFASIITTILSIQPSLISASKAKNETITNGHWYVITKRKSSDSNLENNATSIGNEDSNSGYNNNTSVKTNYEKKLRKNSLFSSWSILIQLAFRNKRYFAIFLIATITYGILFSQISSILVYRSQSFKYLYGINDIPSVTTITYGPAGYVPALSIYITDHMGLFIFPTNLLILIVVSVLVGFNIMLSAFALRIRSAIISTNAHINGKGSVTTTKLGSKRYTFLNSIAYAAGLFTACPTCASYYIFGIVFPSASTTFGSLTLSIASFTSTYYLVIFASSLAVLLFSPFITARTIQKYIFSFQGSSTCNLK
jgi:hypothetical protein